MVMVREIVKVSFLLILLVQSQTGSYNFLHAIDTSVASTTTATSGHEKSSHFFTRHYGVRNSFVGVVKKFPLLISSTINATINQNGVRSGEGESDGWNDNETPVPFHEDEAVEVSTKMEPQQLLLFEQKLLKLLGMKKRPERDRERNEKVPKYFKQLYNSQMKANIFTSNLNLPGRFVQTANTVRSFYNTGDEVKLDGLHFHMNFDISIPSNEKITGAELRVPFNVSGQLSNITIQILLHDVVKIQSSGRDWSSNPDSLRRPISYPIDTKMLKLPFMNSTLWITFDVFPATSRWNLEKFRKRKLISLAIELVIRDGNLLLTDPEVYNHIRVRRSSSTYTNSIKDGSTIPPSTQVPMLLTYSDDGHNPTTPSAPRAQILSRTYRSHQNQKRRKNHRMKNRRRNLCSRKKMFVDFTDVGWNDWIVAPPGYQAFYCSGECPFPLAEHLNATNHAVIQALVNSMNPRLVPPPCCVPKKYSSLSLLYTDNSDRIVLKNYKEMIVDSCGCS